MFSPATRKHHFPSQKDRISGHVGKTDSPPTPFSENQKNPLFLSSAIPTRPSTGTPAPWTSRLSVLARIPLSKNIEERTDGHNAEPVYVGEFPQVVRNAQASFLQKRASGDAMVSGGMDRGSSLSWILCGTQLFVWSYLSRAVSKKCVVLELPSSVVESGDISTKSSHGNSWMVCVINWDSRGRSEENVVSECNSAGIVICNHKTQAVVYWPDIYSEDGNTPIVSLRSSEELQDSTTISVTKTKANWHQQRSWSGNGYVVKPSVFNSLIASAVSGASHECMALACRSKCELWHFRCTSSRIYREEVSKNLSATYMSDSDNEHINKGYARSFVWRFYRFVTPEESSRQFFLLTDHEIQCWNVQLTPDISISKLWSHEIIGTDGNSGIKKDLAGQKQIWLLDLQVDDRGKEFTVLVATFCKDRISGSSYTQYSLLTMQYRSDLDISLDNHGSKPEKVLEKKSPIQVIIPKARVEDEDTLFSMRLRVGGKPSGSTIILSGDGTATVTNYWRGSTRLYQFDLPWDAGKVLDASVLPSTDDSEEGAWVVLTEKAGIWAIPEKAVLLGAVEPPERSLSRKGSSNEGAAEEERRSLALGGNIAPRRVSSDGWDAGNRQRAVLTGMGQRTAQDEESEALLGRLFNDFLSSGQIEGSFEKLRNSGAFEKDGEMNVFVRKIKSIVDTLAKHWTTTRGAEIVAMSVVSSQLLDKQQKHERYLQFLVLSKCHGELRSRQRHSLQAIMEHGEKLAGMIQLRNLHNMLTQNRSDAAGSPYSGSPNNMTGSLWDLIQLVGERARRNTILLMDRDNAEVFFSKVSDLEDLFYCLSHHLQHIILGEQPLMVQVQRACEIANVCTTLIRTVMHYRNTNQSWYPPAEGLTPWFCQRVVRSVLWSVASLVMQLFKEATGFDLSVKSDIFSHLEGLTDIMLEAYVGAITAKIEREEEHKGLLGEYCKRRDGLLDFLYQRVKVLVEARYQDTEGGDVFELKEANLKELYSSLLSIARRHEGYQTLWNICCDLNDTGLLRSFMHESVGPKGGFSYFVFQQLHEMHQYAKLLRLGEEFQEDLVTFLKQHKDLLWLHEIFLKHFSSASETLHALALSQDDDSTLGIHEDSEPNGTKWKPSLVDRRRLLNLSKIAAVAGRDIGFEMKTGRIDADIQILKLQEEILSFHDHEEKQDTTVLFNPEELIEMCLKSKNRELSLRAFDVFAWTSSSFQRSHKGLLEECWKNAADQDDWASLSQASTAEGWSDGERLQFLRGTVLFQASDRCYGRQELVYEGGFDEVLPLRKDPELAILQDPTASVEGILMQHKDFPEAGQLMLTATTMGKFGNDVETEYGSPME